MSSMIRDAMIKKFKDFEASKGGVVKEEDIMELVRKHNPNATVDNVKIVFPKFEGGANQVTLEQFEAGVHRLVEVVIGHRAELMYIASEVMKKKVANGGKCTEADFWKIVQSQKPDIKVEDIQKLIPGFDKDGQKNMTMDMLK